MFEMDDPEIKFALHAVRQAALLIRQVQEELISPALTKDDRSPVTVADFVSQALIGSLLAESFPQDAVVAEEDSAALKKTKNTPVLEQVVSFIRRYSPQANPESVCEWIDYGRAVSASRFWTIDPIDGTKGFLRGDQYVVAFALIEDGLVKLGVLGCPNLVDAQYLDNNGLGSLILAARDQGTWTTPLSEPGKFRQLYVSTQSDPSKGRVMRSYESGHTNVSQIDKFAEALGIQVKPVRLDSQAKYALLAAGKGELLLRLLSPSNPDYREKIWDQAAGSIILEEAGGTITDLDGTPLDFSVGHKLTENRGILATNGVLHQPALDALRKINA